MTNMAISSVMRNITLKNKKENSEMLFDQPLCTRKFEKRKGNTNIEGNTFSNLPLI